MAVAAGRLIDNCEGSAQALMPSRSVKTRMLVWIVDRASPGLLVIEEQNSVDLTWGSSGSDSTAVLDAAAGTVTGAVTAIALDDEARPFDAFAVVFFSFEVAAPDAKRSLRFATDVSDRASSTTARDFAGGILCLSKSNRGVECSERSI